MATVEREIGELVAEVRAMRNDVATVRNDVAAVRGEMRAGFADVDLRLDAGDKRFERDDLAAAESRGRRGVLIVIGGAALTVLSSAGALLLSYLPPWVVQIAEWMSKK
jgi:hypothetical protein